MRVVFTFILLLLNNFVISQALQFYSPSKNISVIFNQNNNKIEIDLLKEDEFISKITVLDFILEKDIVKGVWRNVKKHVKNINQTWTPVYGERNVIHNIYNEITLSYKSVGNDKNIDLKIRLYNEGIAFKYYFDSLDFWDSNILGELTTFQFLGNFDIWTAINAQSAYSKIKLNELKDIVERPLVMKIKEQLYIALGEAACIDYSRTKFRNVSLDGVYKLQTALSGKVNLLKANYHTPWRYVMIANKPGELLEKNDLILNLNKPNEIKDVSWIKPGKVIREVTLTTQGGKACVDYAARNNIKYVEFDAGWYGPENSKDSDASKISVDPARSKGPLDLHEVIDYANKKDIGIILYVNMQALDNQLDHILPLYKEWGIKGLKFGFVNVGDQYWTSWLHHAVRKAAKYELMVDIHDEYRPTGYSRTYPNLITQEGIRGDEESPNIEQSIITLFTRMIAGAGDYTNCFYAPRVHEKMGGKAAQMAKSIMIYSPWQFVYWYDRPIDSPRKAGGAGSSESIILENESTHFYKVLPTVWDETYVSEADIGNFAAIARKKGSNWFLGILNANTKRVKNLDLSFLEPEVYYEATIYSQNKKELLTNTLSITKVKVKNRKFQSISLEKDSGCAIIFSPVNN